MNEAKKFIDELSYCLKEEELKEEELFIKENQIPDYKHEEVER